MTFWIVVAASSNTDTTTLWHQGWLFATTIELSTSSAPWDYWSLFDMERIQWSELLSVSKDLATLVAIGALSLPIFGMATVAKVDVSDHSMNHEFIGHGLANVIAGLGGTLPALMVVTDSLQISIANNRVDLLKHTIFSSRRRESRRSLHSNTLNARGVFRIVIHSALRSYRHSVDFDRIHWDGASHR